MEFFSDEDAYCYSCYSESPYMTDYKLKKSGDEQKFETGAQRDSQEGKPRYDLISPFFLRRLAILLEKGARPDSYGEWNWAKGMPFSRFISSMMRHLFAFIFGKDDEDHLAMLAFGAMCMIHFQETGEDKSKSLDDRPFWTHQIEEKNNTFRCDRCTLHTDHISITSLGEGFCLDCMNKWTEEQVKTGGND